MNLTTILIILIPGVILFLFLNLLARELHQKYCEMKRKAELEEALSESLNLDFSMESPTLKRVVVDDPAARILCVDDEEVVLDSLRKILVLDGYSIDTVETGQEALGLVQSRDYDFVFTDLKMPSMSGTDVAKSVKHLRPDIDVIIITGYATVESAVECMKHGATDYIEKPFTEEELRKFVKRALILRQDQLQRQLKPRVHVTHPNETEHELAGEFHIPGGTFVSEAHCWASLSEDGAVRVGADDFAHKLIGRIDDFDLPEIGSRVQSGQTLFSISQDERRASFQSPVTGKVLEVNRALGKSGERNDNLSYGSNWVCIIEADDLDTELPQLKIGKSAVAFLQDEIERFTQFQLEAEGIEPLDPESLCIGAFEKMDDDRWHSAVRKFFGT